MELTGLSEELRILIETEDIDTYRNIPTRPYDIFTHLRILRRSVLTGKVKFLIWFIEN